MLMIYWAMLENEQDKKKMTELYEEFRYDCLHVALKITNNMAMSEDAVHDAFLAVIKHKEEMFALTCMDFRKKLVIIVKNKCIDLMRKNKFSSYTYIGDIEYELASDLESAGAIAVNNENVIYSTVTNNNFVYHIFESKEEGTRSSIVWDMNGYRFTILSEYPIKELQKMAVSITTEK